MKASFRLRVALISAALPAVLLVGHTGAHAQVGPGPMGPNGPGGEEKKPEGIAEKAPTQPGQLPTTPVLPAPTTKKKRYQLFELNGYFRWRGDYFKNFNLGFDDSTDGLGTPYPRALGCSSQYPGGAPCPDTIKSSNIRLRLEPVINIDEKASVHMQIDVLDNLVLGSTPDGYFGDGTSRPSNIPINAFTGGQVDPQQGRNYLSDSIRVKRAWAEVMTPLGLLKFGRQPSHWGLGILANGGGADPFHGTYDLDADYGDTADRLMFGTIIPGTQYRLAVATDWAATGPTSAQSDLFRNRYDGQPFNLDNNDDVNQWIVVLARLDSPTDFQDVVDQGDMALNYGAYFVYRTQDWDYNPGLTLGTQPDGKNYVKRGATAYIPDAWAHLAYKKLDVEGEAVGIIGSINQLADVSSVLDQELKVRQLGAVGRLKYKMVNDKLLLGFELGYASGDQWDNSPPGTTDVRRAPSLPCLDIPAGQPCNDTTVSAFRFDLDYKIDLILFRELIGTVTNATYLRPSLAYDLTKAIKFSVQSVVSFANKPVATPGNGSMYGVEFDGDLGYKNEGFFAGIAAGVLFPLGAMDHPAALGYMDQNQGGAGNAWTIQSRLGLQF